MADHNVEYEALTKKQRDALTLIADRTDERSPDPGVMCSDATFADQWNVFVNWRTAQALHRAGLVTYPYEGTGYDGDNTSIALTAHGRSVMGVEAPGGVEQMHTSAVAMNEEAKRWLDETRPGWRDRSQ